MEIWKKKNYMTKMFSHLHLFFFVDSIKQYFYKIEMEECFAFNHNMTHTQRQKQIETPPSWKKERSVSAITEGEMIINPVLVA